MFQLRSRSVALLAGCLAASLFAACGGGGGGEDSTPPSALGLWRGWYTLGSSLDHHDYELVLFEQGYARIREGTNLATVSVGTWYLDGDTALVHYTLTGGPLTYTVVGKLSGDGFQGTWGAGTQSTGGGDVGLTRSTSDGVGAWLTTIGVYLILFPDGTAEYTELAMPKQGPTGTWSLTGSTFLAEMVAGTKTISFTGSISGDGHGDDMSGVLTDSLHPGETLAFTGRRLR